MKIKIYLQLLPSQLLPAQAGKWSPLTYFSSNEFSILSRIFFSVICKSCLTEAFPLHKNINITRFFAFSFSFSVDCRTLIHHAQSSNCWFCNYPFFTSLLSLAFSAKRNRANLDLGIPRIVTTPTKDEDKTKLGATGGSSVSSILDKNKKTNESPSREADEVSRKVKLFFLFYIKKEHFTLASP